jgi:hypothetical protein
LHDLDFSDRGIQNLHQLQIRRLSLSRNDSRVPQFGVRELNIATVLYRQGLENRDTVGVRRTLLSSQHKFKDS